MFSEGYYPFRDKALWPDSEGTEPLNFIPTLDAVLDKDEWSRFELNSEEAAEFLKERNIDAAAIPNQGHTHTSEQKRETKQDVTSNNRNVRLIVVPRQSSRLMQKQPEQPPKQTERQLTPQKQPQKSQKQPQPLREVIEIPFEDSEEEESKHNRSPSSSPEPNPFRPEHAEFPPTEPEREERRSRSKSADKEDGEQRWSSY
jgi:hypothetical protein